MDIHYLVRFSTYDGNSICFDVVADDADKAKNKALRQLTYNESGNVDEIETFILSCKVKEVN